MCNRKKECYAWSYWTSSANKYARHCRLKNDNFLSGRNSVSGVISGAKDCKCQFIISIHFMEVSFQGGSFRYPLNWSEEFLDPKNTVKIFVTKIGLKNSQSSKQVVKNSLTIPVDFPNNVKNFIRKKAKYRFLAGLSFFRSQKRFFFPFFKNKQLFSPFQ